MSRRPLPPRGGAEPPEPDPRLEHWQTRTGSRGHDYSGIPDDEPEWIILCGVCALSGGLVAAVILALLWWLA